jgi:hypothetical protein
LAWKFSSFEIFIFFIETLHDVDAGVYAEISVFFELLDIKPFFSVFKCNASSSFLYLIFIIENTS